MCDLWSPLANQDCKCANTVGNPTDHPRLRERRVGSRNTSGHLILLIQDLFIWSTVSSGRRSTLPSEPPQVIEPFIHFFIIYMRRRSFL